MFTLVILPIYDVQPWLYCPSLIFTMVILPVPSCTPWLCYPVFVGTTLTFSALVHSWLRRDNELFLMMPEGKVPIFWKVRISICRLLPKKAVKRRRQYSKLSQCWCYQALTLHLTGSISMFSVTVGAVCVDFKTFAPKQRPSVHYARLQNLSSSVKLILPFLVICVNLFCSRGKQKDGQWHFFFLWPSEIISAISLFSAWIFSRFLCNQKI